MSAESEHSVSQPALRPEAGEQLWQELLWSELAAAEQPLASVSASVAQAIALSAALERQNMPRSLAAELSGQIAAQAAPPAAPPAAKPLTESGLSDSSLSDSGLSDSQVAALLRLPPGYPPSQAGALALAIAREASGGQAAERQPHSARGAGLLAGLNAALAVGGLSVLGRAALAGQATFIAAPLAARGLLGSPHSGGALTAFLSPAALVGLSLLLVTSALLVWRPTSARKVAGVLLLAAGLLTVPAVWSALQHHPQAATWHLLPWGGLLLVGLLLQMGLLLLGGQARTLTTRQSHFPWQALGTGLLTELGLLGLGVLLLALGLPWAMPVLVGVLLLAAVVGLGVSLLSVGRGVHSLLPRAPRWAGALASLGIYGTSLAMPPLAALLLLLGGAWGLGSVLLPQRQAEGGQQASGLA